MKRFLTLFLPIALTLQPLLASAALFVPDKAELGTPKNYILNGGIERGTSGFSTYKNTAQATPVNGTGGSPTHITIAKNTSTPLKDSTSLNIVNSGSTSAQGEGVSYNFTIDSSDQAQMLQLTMDFELVSGTFVSGSYASGNITDSDLELYLYDVTNSNVIQPAGYILTCGSTASTYCTATAQFQTASNSTSYRAIWHVATTHTSAWTLEIDNINVSRTVKTYGLAGSDWTSYSTQANIWSSAGTAPSIGNGSIEAVWRRSGKNMQIRIQILSGTTTTYGSSNSYTFALPSGYTIDNSLVGALTGTGIQGMANARYTNSLTYATGSIIPGSSTSNVSVADTGSNNSAWNSTQPGTWTASAANQTITLQFEVPITGWSSTVQMSDQADGRVQSLQVSTASGSIPNGGSDQVVTLSTINIDTHGIWNGTTTATAPISGYYDLGFFADFNAAITGLVTARYKINSGTSVNLGSATNPTQFQAVGGSTVVKLNAGDTVNFIITQTSSGSITFDSARGYLNRRTGMSAIGTTESVNARYYSATATVTGTASAVTYSTKDYDSHNAYSGSTYTIPVSGKYQITASLLIGATFAAGNNTALQITKNGSVVSQGDLYAGGAQIDAHPTVTDIISCVAGDTIVIKTASAGTTPTVQATTTGNYFAITRVGN